MRAADIAIIVGILFIILGLFWKVGIKFGSLPGDLKIDSGNFRIYFPITTSIIISLLLTVIYLIYRYIS